jgi:hypothetical protein
VQRSNVPEDIFQAVPGLTCGESPLQLRHQRRIGSFPASEHRPLSASRPHLPQIKTFDPHLIHVFGTLAKPTALRSREYVVVLVTI